MEPIERKFAREIAKGIVRVIENKWRNLGMEGWDEEEAVPLIVNRLCEDVNYMELIRSHIKHLKSLPTRVSG